MSAPATSSKSDFASRHGANVLLCMGVATFVAAPILLCLGQASLAIAAALWLVAFFVVALAAGLGRLTRLRVKIGKLVGLQANFRR